LIYGAGPNAEPALQQLPEDVITLLRTTTATACQGLRTDLKGVWADALLPLAHAEWKRLRPVATQGALRCQASDLLHFITPPTATRPNSHRPLDPCAVAAVAALATVSRVCALVQVRGILFQGHSTDLHLIFFLVQDFRGGLSCWCRTFVMVQLCHSHDFGSL
jgi:hypothetical protein